MFEGQAKYADALAGACTSPLADRTPSPPHDNASRSNSVTTLRTRPMAFASGPFLSYERDPNVPLSDDEVIIITVRFSNKARRQSWDDPLPARPPKRGFLRRMSTRILPPADEDRYKAVKMPRGDYKRFFKRDADGNYAGTEAQREWDEEDVARMFGQYQDLPLGSMV